VWHILGIVGGFQWGSSRSWLLGLVAAFVGIFIGGMSGFTVGMLLELSEEFVSRTFDKLLSKSRILAFLFRSVCALLVLTVVCGGLYWGVRTFARNQRSKATSTRRDF
jgi:ABC-type dipeptide/oligopeptide/nickel transport system permease subunit